MFHLKMKIFLDVGSHIGQTLEEVVDPYHSFDRIVSFEPSKVCFESLKTTFSNSTNIVFNNFGLSNETKICNLYDTGTDGASVYADKIDLRERNNIEQIHLVEAAEWIRNNTEPTDVIYMKLNCEGSECDIIENLLEKGVYDRIAHIMIDFDVRKIPSQHHRQEVILNLLKDKKNFHECSQVMIGNTHQNRIRNWLRVCG